VPARSNLRRVLLLMLSISAAVYEGPRLIAEGSIGEEMPIVADGRPDRVEWRFADGSIEEGAVTDLSGGGSLLLTGRDLQAGNWLRVTLVDDA
jgi:hypothetical protein